VRLGTSSAGLGRPPGPDERALREARVVAARRNPYWTELREAELVERPPAYLVDSESDRVFSRYRGPVFERGQERPSLQEQVGLSFYVTADNELVFLEPVPGTATWSQIVERQARRGRATRRTPP
jgi:hypothetical protein